MEERTSSIAPPPSLDDILSSKPESRLGQVDFTSRLAPEPEPEVEEKVEARHAADDTAADADEEGTAPVVSTPSVMPVARLEDMPAPVREVEDDLHAEGSASDVSEAEPAPEEITEPMADHSDEQALYDELAVRAEAERPTPKLSEPPVPAAVRTSAAPQPEASKPAATPLQPEVAASAPAGGGAELDYLGLSVDEVAASVIARMREAGEASRRHLESIEGEAARRCELLTAQAELDAELIRLHARREAHAIITAARSRAGAGSGSDTDSARLNEIGETFSRFAESIETTVAEAPQSPDHPYRP